MGSDTDRSFYGGYKNILGLDQGGGLHITVNILGVGDGNPLQCSCLENPRDRGAWWAAVYGVAWSQTRLK